MASGIRDKVAVVGFGVTRSGEHWAKGADDMLVECATEALRDAGLETKDIQAAWACGAAAGLSRTLKLGHMPVSKIDNGWASGADSFRNAAQAVAAGAHDIVMAAACDKLKDEGKPPPLRSLLLDLGNHPWSTAPAMAAPLAVRYMDRCGLSLDGLKAALAHIATKNRLNGTANSKAFLQEPLSGDQYSEAPMIAWPLSTTDCAPIADAVAVCILTTPEIARQLKSNYVLVKGLGAATIDGATELSSSTDPTTMPMNATASRIAYRMAGVTDPSKEIDEYNVYDAFTILELLAYESLGLCAPGSAPEHIKEGFFDAGGALPVNTDGGITCAGLAFNTVGLRVLYEPYLQLTGQAEKRQLRNVRLAAAQSQGSADAVSSLVVVLGARD